MNTLSKFMIGAVVVAVLFFYAGLKYEQSHPPLTAISGRSAYAAGARARTGATGATGAGAAGGGIVSGTLLSIDSQGITVSTQGGGSKIVFLSASTTVTTT